MDEKNEKTTEKTTEKRKGVGVNGNLVPMSMRSPEEVRALGEKGREAYKRKRDVEKSMQEIAKGLLNANMRESKVKMRNQEELKKAMQEVLEKQVWTKSPKMVDYCMKKAAYIVELSDGDFAEIDKPTIETDFCFGYGMYGVSTDEDYDRAASMERHARTNESYFVQENLKGIDRMIEQFQDDGMKTYKRLHYIGQTEGSPLKSIEFCRYWETPEKGWQELTEQEKQAMIAGYEIVRAQFVKRLNTYLKRYGTSKLHTWTYLVD